MNSHKNRPIIEDQRVFVYYNLHKKVFSIKSLEGKTKGKVIAHANEVMLRNCIFKVNEKNRLRVLKTRQKNVHAGVIGYLSLTSSMKKGSQEVTYNPYFYSSFVDCRTKSPIHSAKSAYLINKKIYI
jgi:hypothetical protein